MNPLEEIQQLLYGDFREKIQERDHESLVVIGYAPMFCGSANTVNIEDPEIHKLLYKTQYHRQFRHIVQEIGLRRVTLLVESCLRRKVWSSRASFFGSLPECFHKVLYQSGLFYYLPKHDPFVVEIPLAQQKSLRAWIYTVAEEGSWDYGSPLISHILGKKMQLGATSVEIKYWHNKFRSSNPAARLLNARLDWTRFGPRINRERMVDRLFQGMRSLRNLTEHRELYPVDDTILKAQDGQDMMALFGDHAREEFYSDVTALLQQHKKSLKELHESTRAALKGKLMEKNEGRPYFCSLKELPKKWGENEAQEMFDERRSRTISLSNELIIEALTLLKKTGSPVGAIYGGLGSGETRMSSQQESDENKSADYDFLQSKITDFEEERSSTYAEMKKLRSEMSLKEKESEKEMNAAVDAIHHHQAESECIQAKLERLQKNQVSQQHLQAENQLLQKQTSQQQQQQIDQQQQYYSHKTPDSTSTAIDSPIIKEKKSAISTTTIAEEEDGTKSSSKKRHLDDDATTSESNIPPPSQNNPPLKKRARFEDETRAPVIPE